MWIEWLSNSRGHPLGTLAESGRWFLFFQWLPKGEFEGLYWTLWFVCMFDYIIGIYTVLTDSPIYSDIHNFCNLNYGDKLITVSDII